MLRGVLPEVSPRLRIGATCATWALIVLSQPGLGRPGGFGHTAFVALVPWALVCSRPGPRAKLIEWLVGAVGLIGMVFWMRHLLPWLVPLLGLVPGVYLVLSGVLLRRLARRYPLALAVPVAWTIAEALRWGLNAPFSFGWWRLGTMAHDTGWLAGSARVWGVWGLTWIFAAFAGWIADLWRQRHPLPGYTPASTPVVHVLGLGPLILGIVFSLLVPAPATVDGPRVLLVTPGLDQALKAGGSGDPLFDLFLDPATLTAEGLAAAEAAGEPIDLVAWGETMLYGHALADGVEEAFDTGANAPEWTGKVWTEDWLFGFADVLDMEVLGVLFGRADVRSPQFEARLAEHEAPWVAGVLAGGALLPEGTSFLSGTEIVVAHGDELRRLNGAYLWDADGERGPPAAKVHLVPGAEDMRGLQRLEFILDTMQRVGNYIPDFVAADEVAILDLRSRDGQRSWKVGTTICYDNVYDDPYSDPTTREGSVDFHIVGSNEAWYVESPEMDHMVAFTRLAAIASGRSIARATNSGVTLVVDPAGRDVAVLADADGRRKMARGTLRAVVPVPQRDADGSAPVTFYARTRNGQQVLGWAVLLALLLLAFRPVTPGDDGVRATATEDSEPPGGP